MSNNVEKMLAVAAEEMVKAGHNGWGNVLQWGAEEIARLQAVVDAARELANYWVTSDEALKAKIAVLEALRALDGEPCPTCRGRQTIPIVVVGEGTVRSEPCPACRGTGLPSELTGVAWTPQELASMGLTNGDTCPTCGGRGYFRHENWKPCPTCRGTGRKPCPTKGDK